MLDPDLTSIAHLPRNLLLAGYSGGIPAPRKVYDLVLRASIRTEMINGRWYYFKSDEPKIAATLGLVKAPPAVASRPRRKAAGGAPQQAAA